MMTFAGYMPQSRFHTTEMSSLCVMLYAYALIHMDTHMISCLYFTVGLTTLHTPWATDTKALHILCFGSFDVN